MAGRGFIADSPELADIVELVYDSAEVFKAGALVVVASDGELTECGADPAAIRGVALEPAARGPGFQMADSPVVITGRQNKVSIVAATPTQKFWGRGVNGGTDPVTPTQTMVNESYGVVKDSDGIWAIDISDTSNTRVTITRVDIENKLFQFKFLTANIQL